MNATRYKIREMLRGFGLPLETGTGGRTKYNRTRAGLAKSHWADAACVGASTPESWKPIKGTVHHIRSKSYARRGRRQVCLPCKVGFTTHHKPCGHKNRGPKTFCPGKSISRAKAGVRFFGYQTPDVVRVEIPKGKNAGVHIVRLGVRANGSFDMKPKSGKHSRAAKTFKGSYKHIKRLVDRCGSFEYDFDLVAGGH